MKEIFRKKDLKLFQFLFCVSFHIILYHSPSTITSPPSYLSHTSISIYISVCITNNKTQNLKMELIPNICPNYIFHKFSSLACIQFDIVCFTKDLYGNIQECKTIDICYKFDSQLCLQRLVIRCFFFRCAVAKQHLYKHFPICENTNNI